MSIDGYYIKRIGENRGRPRIWLEGSQTERAGFAPGQRFDVVVHGRTVVLQANPDGSRVVSGKRAGEKVNPVIDLNSKELLALFDGMAAVRVAVRKGEIFILPLASELKKQERFNRLRAKLEEGDPICVGSLSHGGGILSHAMHQGFKAAGLDSRLAFANEIRPELLEHAAIHNEAWDEQTKPFAAPMQELAFDERGVAAIPKVEVAEAGFPCSGASLAGRARRGLAHPEAHPEVGHLVVAGLVILAKANPAAIVLENAVPYASSASADILRLQLRDMGYITHERILRGREWGELEDRQRWCMVAVTQGIEFDFDQLQPPGPSGRTLKDVLDDIPDGHPAWSPMEGLKTKQVRDQEKGRNFRMQTFDGDSTYIGTITKGYSKVRSTDPKIRSSSDPSLLRQLTPVEHARIKGVPGHLIEGLSPTIAHEVLGQGVLHRPFSAVGKLVGEALTAAVGKGARARGARFTASNDEVLGREVRIAALAAEVVSELQRPDLARGQYSGQVVAVDGDAVVLDLGRSTGVLLERTSLDRPPRLGESVRVRFRGGQGTVEGKGKPQQMSLGI